MILRNLLGKKKSYLNHVTFFRGKKKKIRQFFWNFPNGLQEERQSRNETF